jgi:DHA1 family multidrug resistance protein-like MFS transporter
MKDMIRDSALGQLIRFFAREKFLPYPEDAPGFVLPESFNIEKLVAVQSEESIRTSVRENARNSSEEPDLEDLESLHRDTTISNWPSNLGQTLSRATLGSREVKPTLTQDGKLLITWYSTDDPENPQNWSSGKKLWVSFLIWYDSWV